MSFERDTPASPSRDRHFAHVSQTVSDIGGASGSQACGETCPNMVHDTAFWTIIAIAVHAVHLSS